MPTADDPRAPSAAALSLTHHGWDTPLTEPAMANREDRRPGVRLTNRHLLRDGVPVVPVSGEVHYSRIPRERWAERLRSVRAGGVTAVSTYVFWLHHEPVRGRVDFTGGLDVAAFVDECERTGLDVVLRIGPWCHGEARNGGFPDWVAAADVAHRTDDPAYLDLVTTWFGHLAAALGGRSRAEGGPVLAVQLENELYDQPGHLRTLKRLAREAGIAAPLWTATAWGGADLPDPEVLPLFGGYADGFWVDADHPWDPTFREHFFFSHVWDDPGIGADLRHDGAAGAPGAVPRRAPSTVFPLATCELGGGMATAYHRRPRPTGRDVAAVAHAKLGNGSVWQGYYMYAGGTNPGPDLQESHATGYPNDLPRLGYDFHAPVGESGALGEGHAELRRQHAFLAAFGDRLATMPSSLPDVLPEGVEDTATPRWAVRADAATRSGFVFLGTHQPHVPLPALDAVRFAVRLDGETVTFPATPATVPAGTLARWPFGLRIGPARVDHATATVLTELPTAPRPTLVLVADAEGPVEVSVDGEVHRLAPRRDPHPLGGVDLLVLPLDLAPDLWVQEAGPTGPRRLLLSGAELGWGGDGVVDARGTATAPEAAVEVYDPLARAFTPLPTTPGGASARQAGVGVVLVREPGRAVPVVHGKHEGRASAPTPDVVDAHAAVWRLDLPAWVHEEARDPRLELDWAGDVGELRVDGRVVTDRFWDGSRWSVALRDHGIGPASVLTLHVLPLPDGAPVHVPADALRRRVRAAGGQLCALDGVRVVDPERRREAR